MVLLVELYYTKLSIFVIFIPDHMIVAGYYVFMCRSVCRISVPLSIRISFPDDNHSNRKGAFFIQKMLIAFLFLHKNKCCGYSLEVPHRGASNEYPQHTFSWRNKKNNMWIPPLICSYDNLSKHKWIFIKFGMCIDIVEIWFGIANGQISSNFDRVICLRHAQFFVSGRKLEKVSRDLNQTWYMHWYLVWDC